MILLREFFLLTIRKRRTVMPVWNGDGVPMNDSRNRDRTELDDNIKPFDIIEFERRTWELEKELEENKGVCDEKKEIKTSASS
jgi:hypothetical protein